MSKLSTSNPTTFNADTCIVWGSVSGGSMSPITIPVATTSQTGLMSATDKTALAAAAPWPTGTASAALSGHRAVTINSSGLVAYAAPGDAVAGIITSAYSSGATVTIRHTGLITESSWTWTAGAPIYLAANGILTQTTPTSGILQILGWAQTTTSMLVDIQPSIQLAD